MAVLVVDDNTLNRRLVQVHLERLGQTVIPAENGAAAIAALESTPEIDIVVTDVMMPEMDGWSLVARMRERPEWGGSRSSSARPMPTWRTSNGRASSASSTFS